MRVLYRSFVAVSLSLGLFGGGLFAYSCLAGQDGPLGVLRASFSVLVQEWNKHEELDHCTDHLVRRNVLKSEIIARLVEEKITLREAVAEFETVMGQTGNCTTPNEGANDDLDECEIAQNVMAWLKQELVHHPQKKSLLQKIQRELRKSYPHSQGI